MLVHSSMNSSSCLMRAVRLPLSHRCSRPCSRTALVEGEAPRNAIRLFRTRGEPTFKKHFQENKTPSKKIDRNCNFVEITVEIHFDAYAEGFDFPRVRRNRLHKLSVRSSTGAAAGLATFWLQCKEQQWSMQQLLLHWSLVSGSASSANLGTW